MGRIGGAGEFAISLRRLEGTFCTYCGHVGLFLNIMRNRTYAGNSRGTVTIRRELYAIVAYAGNSTRTIRRNSRVRIVGVAGRRTSGNVLTFLLAGGSSSVSNSRLIRAMTNRFLLVLNGIVRARHESVVSNFYRAVNDRVIEDADLRLRERFLRDNLLRTRALGRLTASLV